MDQESATGLVWKGKIVDFLNDTTREIDLEGALSSGKTTGCIFKELEALKANPGMWSFACRYSDKDTSTKLKPAFEELMTYRRESPLWNSKEMFYEFEQGQRLYMFGIKAADQMSRYSKLRGLGVSRIYVDQAEELPGDISLELRARLRQKGFNHQLTFSPNPTNVNHWLAKQFPDKNTIAGRRYLTLSLYDNAHNLPQESITALEAAYPPEHAKHRSVILGLRGVNVMGEPVYGGYFARKLHVCPIRIDEDAPILEGIVFGRGNPCIVWCQQPYAGGLRFLGGILGQELFLEDFLPIARRHRRQWFGERAVFKSCCPPMGEKESRLGTRYTNLNILRKAQFTPIWKDTANAPDVRSALIERIGGYMRRRTIDGEEALTVSDDVTHWLRASREGIEQCPFITEGFEAGYVWARNTVSVSNEEIRVPLSDDWFEHGMRCVEQIELNFGCDLSTSQERDQRSAAVAKDRTNRMPSSSATSWMSH